MFAMHQTSVNNHFDVNACPFVHFPVDVLTIDPKASTAVTMKSIKSLLFSNPALIVCFLCFLVLLSLSVVIWDVNNLIEDYAEDNRITTIRRWNITDKFPFLDNMSISLFYSPPNPRFLPTRTTFQNLMPGVHVS